MPTVIERHGHSTAEGMMKYIVMLLLLISMPVRAEFHLDIAVGYLAKSDLYRINYEYKDWLRPWRGPIGSAEFSYWFDSKHSIAVIHSSSFQMEDDGLWLLNFKRRLF